MNPTTLRSLRRWHHYIGVFLAPAILFFAFSGFIQVVGWQDQRNPSPPGWISLVAGIHKKQAAPKPRAAAPVKPRGVAAPTSSEHHDEGDAFTPLKIFALLTALGLFATTLIGLAVALGTRTMRRTSLIMLAAGVVIPAILMAL